MLESEFKEENRKDHIRKILDLLTTTHKEETTALCADLGLKLEDFNPASVDNFSSKGVTSDLKDIRYLHFEECRIAKIIKIASEVVKALSTKNPSDIEELKLLLSPFSPTKNSRKSSARPSRSESLFAFTKPSDIIIFGLEKEREKFQKSVQALERITNLREKAKAQAELKRKLFEKKEKTVVRNRNKKENEFRKTVLINNEKRQKILQKKYKIRENIDKLMAEYGVNLEKRMAKLSELQKIEIREKLKKKHLKLREKLENERKRLESHQKQIQDDNFVAEELINQIQNKINKKVADFMSSVQTRVQSAKSHSLKVDSILRTSIQIDSVNYFNNLRKSVDKSLLSSKKLDKKLSLTSDSSQKLKNMMNESFKKHRRGLSEKNEEELRRLEQIKTRIDSKQRVFRNIQKNITKKYEEKRQKNFLRMENHFRSYIEKQREEVITR